MKDALRARILEVSWMTEATKTEALRKLEKIGIKIGYPVLYLYYITCYSRYDNDIYVHDCIFGLSKYITNGRVEPTLLFIYFICCCKDTWQDYTNLNIRRGFHLENIFASKRFALQLELDRMNTVTDR